MKEVHKISFIAIGYALILCLVTWIFFSEYLLWVILGSLTALFNHSQMIHTTKGKYSAQMLVLHIVQRYAMYTIIIAIAWFDTKDLVDQTIMIRTFIFLLLGFIAVKVGALIYATPLIKKPVETGEYVDYDDPDS